MQTLFTFLLGGLLLTGGAIVAGRYARRADDDGAVLMTGTGQAPGSSAWQLPPTAEPYRLAIQAAEGRHGIPRGLLGRLLYQESRFRPDIINGAVTSSAGAVGIAQIVPRWHPDVDPLDPFASIDYAANYLASLRARFGRWDLALAAYNWGQGNLAGALTRNEWPTQAPGETRAYVQQITRDVPV